MRSTWIVELRERIDRELIASAAGMVSSAGLARYDWWVPPIHRGGRGAHAAGAA